MQPLTAEESKQIQELMKFVWEHETLVAFVENADLLVKFNEWIGLALYYKQFAMFSSLIQAVFSLGYQVGKTGVQPKLDLEVWGNAFDEAFAKENE
jgi:hypothetical protein